MKKTIAKIPTLSPLIFKNNHIKNNTDTLLKDENIGQFFIHSFKNNDVNLNLPLPPHKKTVNDFVFVSSGRMTRNLGIDSYHLKKNDFLFTPKDSITTIEFVSSDLEGYYCHFSDEFIGANPFMTTLHGQAHTQNYSRISEKEADDFEFLLGRILHLYQTREANPNNYRLIPFYLSTVIAEFFLNLSKQPILLQQNNTIAVDFMAAVRQYAKQNLTIQAYAALLNITPNHLNKRVKQETGKTASTIINEITILEAKVLLLQTGMTISDISLELGFNDASYFSRFFKNETNHSPTDYRKMIDLS